MLRLPRRWAIACSLLLIVSVPAEAIELPAGSKNFSPPSSTPNYFSNETGAMQGRAAAPRGAASAPAPQPNIVFHSAGGRGVAAGRRGKRYASARGRGRGRAAYVSARGRGSRAVAATRSGRRATVAAARSRVPAKSAPASRSSGR